MLQGKPLLPPAAVPGITARLPGNLLGFGFRMPEDAVLLRSSFPKTPLTGKKGFKWLKLGVWVKEKKSLKWYNEQWVGLEGLFLLENRFFFSWNDSEFCSPQRGAWEWEGRSWRVEQDR